MKPLKQLPLLRVFHRYWREVTRPAPLTEFANYDEYWQARVRDGKRADVLDRFRTVARLLPADARVLDIGCGDGAFLHYLRNAKPSCRLMGADISTTAIKELQARGIEGQHIDPLQPLHSQLQGTWDFIVLMEVIEHVAEAEQLVRQVLALEPKRVFVTIPNVGFILYRLRLMFAGRFPITTIIYHMKEHIRFWTVKDFHQWAESLGMKVCSYHGQVDRPDKIVRFVSRRAPSLFASQMVYELEPDSHRHVANP